MAKKAVVKPVRREAIDAVTFVKVFAPMAKQGKSAHEIGLALGMTGEKAKITGCPAITIAMVLISMEIPAIICGPGSIAQAHTEDEWIEVAQLPKAARIYTALMAEM